MSPGQLDPLDPDPRAAVLAIVFFWVAVVVCFVGAAALQCDGGLGRAIGP